ncbi:MAG: hypothetical protein IIA88_08365 [Bacteroidetes bacterium]|nr:hypothetical protein [Bacteroidota bacterium]
MPTHTEVLRHIGVKSPCWIKEILQGKLLFNGALCAILYALSPFTLIAQIKDTAANIPVFFVNTGYELPGGDMADRFGNNAEIGGGFFFKTKSNWIFGIDGNFLWGNNVKEDNILDSIKTESGEIIGSDGLFAEVRISERGMKLPFVKIGKLWNCKILKTNANSGCFVLIGYGLLQHKIKIQDITRTVPQLAGDYVKGYDRLTNGAAITESFGYLYLDKKKRINFFINFEFTQAWTKSRREYNFDTMTKDETRRFDTLWGIKFGWLMPIYKKVPDEYYYY